MRFSTKDVQNMRKFLLGVVCIMLVLSTGTTPALSQTSDNSYKAIAKELDEKAYSGDDLGAVYQNDKTSFKVWAPTADRVELTLYKTGSDDEEGAGIISRTDMKLDEKTGVYSLVVTGDIKNVYYTYLVTVEGKTNETADIYAKACGVNGERSMVVDLNETDPQGWGDDNHILADEITDAIVWEIHVKDFSNQAQSGIKEEYRGKYLAFTQTGTTLNSKGVVPTGIDYLKALGVGYVHINPFYDFGSIDETSTDEESFNWGYDPKNYNVPEGSYSTNPYDGNVRIREAKEMIKALHDAGIGVIMDVVYNHTYTGEDSFFNLTVPNYYYRINADGTWSNNSGCGNDTASERAMFRKYMVDSVKYWAEEYHIDGFRFDLMGLHDVETMKAVRAGLNLLPNGEKIIIYGEAWNMATNVDVEMATQPNIPKIGGVAAFNDGIRDGLRGSTFDAMDQGLLQGRGGRSVFVSGIKAATNDWADNPSQTVTYTTCHDNLTLYDKLAYSVKGADTDFRKRDDSLVSMNKLAGACVLTSQGMSFILAGEEFARSKDGDHNSYKSPASLNQLDWTSIVKYKDLTSYYAGLIDIRNNYKPFRDSSNATIETMTFFENTDKRVTAYTLENSFKREGEWNKVMCIFNFDTEEDKTVEFEGNAQGTDWVIVANHEEAGLSSLGEAAESVVIKPSSAMVLVDKESFTKAGLKENNTLKTALEKIEHESADKNTQANKTDSSTADEIKAYENEDNKASWLLPITIAAAGIACVAAAGVIMAKRFSRKKKRK